MRILLNKKTDSKFAADPMICPAVKKHMEEVRTKEGIKPSSFPIAEFVWPSEAKKSALRSGSTYVQQLVIENMSRRLETAFQDIACHPSHCVPRRPV